jgi:hypothetical protein
MKPNLDELKAEIPQQIESRGLTLFPGFSRVMDQVAMVFWNSKKNPDYHEFLDAAQKTGAKVIVFYDREFAAELIEDALEHLEEAELSREEQRSYERRLREMRVYDGFTCAIELSFDLNGVAYLFELRTDWYEELTEILDDIEASIPDDDEDDDDAHLGGYFSKN